MLEKNSDLFSIVAVAVVGVLAVPVILPHVFHGLYILRILLHVAGIALATFLAAPAVVAHRRAPVRRMRITAAALSAFIAAEAATLTDATWPGAYDMGGLSLLEVGHLLMLLSLGLLAVGFSSMADGPDGLPRARAHIHTALLVERNPGIKFRKTMRATGLKNGVASHYLGRLEMDGSVRAVRAARQSRYCPPGMPDGESAVIKALRRETPRRILRRLMEAGWRGLEFSEMPGRAGRALSTVSACLSQLVGEGVVLARRRGRARAYAVADRGMVDRLAERCHSGLLDRPAAGLQEIISAL